MLEFFEKYHASNPLLLLFSPVFVRNKRCQFESFHQMPASPMKMWSPQCYTLNTTFSCAHRAQNRVSFWIYELWICCYYQQPSHLIINYRFGTPCLVDNANADHKSIDKSSEFKWNINFPSAGQDAYVLCPGAPNTWRKQREKKEFSHNQVERDTRAMSLKWCNKGRFSFCWMLCKTIAALSSIPHFLSAFVMIHRLCVRASICVTRKAVMSF